MLTTGTSKQVVYKLFDALFFFQIFYHFGKIQNKMLEGNSSLDLAKKGKI